MSSKSSLVVDEICLTLSGERDGGGSNYATQHHFYSFFFRLVARYTVDPKGSRQQGGIATTRTPLRWRAVFERPSSAISQSRIPLGLRLWIVGPRTPIVTNRD